MVVIHRLVVRRVENRPNQRIGRILPEIDRRTAFGMAEVMRHRLPDERGKAQAPAARLIAQLFVGFGR